MLFDLTPKSIPNFIEWNESHISFTCSFNYFCYSLNHIVLILTQKCFFLLNRTKIIRFFNSKSACFVWFLIILKICPGTMECSRRIYSKSLMNWLRSKKLVDSFVIYLDSSINNIWSVINLIQVSLPKMQTCRKRFIIGSRNFL